MMNSYRFVVGLNHRNRDLVMKLNTPVQISLANDKIRSKRVMKENGISTPELLAELHSAADAERFTKNLRLLKDGFVLKPAQGAQGRGVHIFTHALEDGTFLPISDPPISARDFRYLIASILSGEYSGGRMLDSVLVERRIYPDHDWVMNGLSGPPDLRVLVVEGNAVMAMLRLPTIKSGGRSNLHRGAVGVGVDLETGMTTHAIWHQRPITHHPDTGEKISDRVVQGFEECLRLSKACYPALGLGYFGADIMLDAYQGPTVLEINARPGLAIQSANRRGLRGMDQQFRLTQDSLL